MLSKDQCLDAIKKIDFGDIDGYGDRNLEKYFLDDSYWDKIINKDTFFVIARKGTGKSSVYRMIEDEANKRADTIESKDFGAFPFEKLLKLDDMDFSRPNQYQSIWKNLILNLFALMISKQPSTGNIYQEQIEQYVKNCIGNVVELHKEILNMSVKTSGGLSFRSVNLGREAERAVSIGSGSNNITQINSALYDLIINYFISYLGNCNFIIQFDRLDDNYNMYQDLEKYFNAIISLFKVVYQINQDFRYKNIINAKIIIYLRSDIYRELSKRDAESARWDDFKTDLDWAIKYKSDWEDPKLLKMVNKRIYVSLPELDEDANFRSIFFNDYIAIRDRRGENIDVFKYIIQDTMQRPRDLIQFCKCIQHEVKKENDLYYRIIRNAESTFVSWLLKKEIANEINPIVKDTEHLFELLKLIGSKFFSLTDFKDRFRSVKGLNMDCEELAYYLYDVGIIENVRERKSGPPEFRSIMRNQDKLDRNMKMTIHRGIWLGLNN